MAQPLEAFRRLLEPLANRVRLAVSRAIVRAVDDARAVQELQVTALAGETMGRVERFAHFGLASSPPIGSEAVIVCVGASRDHAIVVADEHRPSRPTGVLQAGEAMVYAQGGTRVHVKADGSVVVTAPAGVQVSHDLEAGGNLVAGGDVEDALGTLDALRQAYNVHTHPDPQGGSTGPPVPTV